MEFAERIFRVVLVIALISFCVAVAIAQVPLPPSKGLVLQGPALVCDTAQLTQVVRAAILGPENQKVKKQALDMLDVCDKVFIALKQNLERAQPVVEEEPKEEPAE